MQRRSYGPTAWILVDVVDPAGLAHGISSASLPGVREVIPAESTVVVVCERDRLARVGEQIDVIAPSPTVVDQPEPFTIDVVYDGVDLHDVALAAGLGVDEVISRHVASDYRVAFCGFSPGFAYLGGLHPTLHLPRRSSPRARVPVGAVAIAAGYSAVYPGPSPGGWHLIGTSRATLWDIQADPPAALWPGRVVRFRQVDT